MKYDVQTKLIAKIIILDLRDMRDKEKEKEDEERRKRREERNKNRDPYVAK